MDQQGKPSKNPIQRKTLTVGNPSPVMRKVTAQIHTGPSGLSLAAQERVAKIRIPNIQSTDHLHQVIADLQEVYEKYASARDWYVNISELENFPISLAGALYAFHQELSQSKCTVVLEVEDLFHFRAALVAKLKKSFQIRKPQPSASLSTEKRIGA